MQQNVLFIFRMDIFVYICYTLDMKKIRENYNYMQILELIVSSAGISRAQIARKTNLNRSTISYVINYFMDNNIVFETKEKVLTGGRASTLIKFNYDLYDIILIDLQKNKLKILVSNLKADIKDRLDFPVDHAIESTLMDIQTHTKVICDKYPSIKSCGLSIHGSVSDNRKILSSPFYNYSYDQLSRIFTNLGLTLYMENESNVYTNGILCSEELKTDNLINIHIKDGIGCGQILNGILQKGDNGFAGEIGHSITVVDGLQCKCGNKGCFELYCSERAMIEQIESITGKTFELSQLKYLILTNPEVYKVYANSVKMIAGVLNNLLLFTDNQTLYITTDFYSEISEFKDNLLSQFHSKNHMTPHIRVTKSYTTTFAIGFANIILKEEFGI